MAKKMYDYVFKIMLIGDSSVGKSSIIIRFFDQTFNPIYMNTIGKYDLNLN